jgi:3-carboxy-cis,cis-muconate cycloisomerase
MSGLVQEHERALGGWQAEWDTLPEIVMLAAGALRQMREVASGLSVDAQRMRRNIDATQGQVMAEAVTLALGAGMGRLQAHQLVEQACHAAGSSGRHLRELLLEDPAIGAQLSPHQIDQLLDPTHYTGQAEAFIDRVLATHRTYQSDLKKD